MKYHSTIAVRTTRTENMWLLSQIVNAKLLPALRDLGIPCPDDTRDVLQPATEYHHFILATPTSGDIFLIGEITPIGPTTPLIDSLSELGISTGEKQLLLADPELFKKAIDFITPRWRAMQRYEDIHILAYIETHSQSQRALFHKSHINRLLALSGHEPDTDIDWVRLPYSIAIGYINKARRLLGIS